MGKKYITAEDVRRQWNERDKEQTYSSNKITAEDVRKQWESVHPTTQINDHQTKTTTDQYRAAVEQKKTETQQNKTEYTPQSYKKYLEEQNAALKAELAKSSLRPQVGVNNRLTQDIVNAPYKKEKAIIDEYEGYKAHNPFERLANRIQRINNKDLPNYAEESARHQQLELPYREIKQKEAYKDLLNRGFTQEDFYNYGHSYLSEDEKEELRKEGKSELEIQAIEKDLYQKSNEVAERLAPSNFVPKEGVDLKDYYDMMWNYYNKGELEEWAQDKPVTASAGSIALNPFESTADVIDKAIKYFSGNSVPYNDTLVNTIRGGVSNNIDSNIGKTLYMGGMSIGDTALAAATAYATGGGSLVSAGIQALEKASQVMNEGAERALSPDQIFAEGVASGVTTYLTEKIPMGKLEDIAEHGLSTYSQEEISKVLFSMFVTEGAQEASEDLADYIADAVIAWDKNEFNTDVQNYISEGYSQNDAVLKAIADRGSEMFTDAVIGGISGLGLGGASTAIAYSTGKVNSAPSVQTDVVAQSPDALEMLKEATKSLDVSNIEDTERIEHAQEIASKPSEEITTEDIVDMANVLQEQGKTDEIQNINYQANLESNINQYNETGKIEQKEEELPIEKAARKEAESLAVQYEKALEEREKQRQKALDNEIRNFEKNIKNNNVEPSKETNQKLNDAAEYFENEAAAKNYINNYKGQNMLMYTEASYQAYMAGEIGQDFEKFVENSREAQALLQYNQISKDYLKTLYYNGQNAKTEENENVTLKTNKNRGKVTGLVEGDVSKDYKSLVSKALGVEYHTDSTDATQRGSFEASVARVIVNATADNEIVAGLHEIGGEYARAYNKKGMDIAQKTLVDFIVERSSEAKFRDAVDAYKTAYRKAGEKAKPGSSLAREANKTDAEAAEEFINDAISYILSTETGFKNWIDYLNGKTDITQKEKVSAFQAIKDFIDRLIKSIKNYMASHKTKQLGYKYMEDLKLTVEDLDNLSRMMIGVIDGARANLETMTKEQKTEQKQEKTEKKAEKKTEKTAHSIEVEYEESTDQELLKYVNSYISDPESYKKPYIIEESMSEELTKAISETVGFSVDGYKQELPKDSLNHIETRHGINGKADQSMKDPADIARIKYVIENFDRIGLTGEVSKAFKNSDGTYSKKIMLIKKIGNKFYYVVEAVPDSSAKRIAVTSAYINANDTFSRVPDANSSKLDGLTERESDVSFSDSNIAESKEKSNTQDAEIKKNFSLDVPYEETKNLIAVHNLSDEKLKGAIELGGFPMPSIAITKADMDHSKFGSISVVFRKDTIDPKANKANNVYSGDAYTPTFPRMGYKINRNKLNSIEERIENLLGDKKNAFGYVALDPDNMTDYLERNNGKAADAYYNKEAMQYAYTVDKGLKMDVPMKEANLSNHFDNEEVKYIALMFTPEEALRIHQNASQSYKEFQQDGRLQKILEKINAIEKKWFGELYEKHKTKEVSFADFDYLISAILRYKREGIKQEVDRSAFSKKIRNVISENEEDYRQWLKDLFEGIVDKRGIRNNKDTFTSSGNRRNWESLYDEYNLTNIVKAMKAEPEVGQSLGGYTLLGSVNRKFDSIEDIHSEEGRLRTINDDEYGELRQKIQDDIYEIAKRLKPNPSWDVLSICSDIAEAAAKRKTRSGIKSFLSEWYKVSESDMDDIMAVIGEAKELPTGYFEAKPRRAVGLDEVAAVVVPSDDTEMIDLLNEKNIPVVEYERGNKESRIEAVNSVEDARFSIDVQYDQAYKNNDTETMDKLIKEAAREAGYDSPLLYHGTMDFGFTQIDLDKSDDKFTFFATNKESIASSYSGTQKARGINESGEITEDQIVEELEKLHRWKDIREFKAGDEQSRYKYLRERFKRINVFVKSNEKDMYDRELMKAYREFSNTLAEQIMLKNIDDKEINRLLRPLREAQFVISDYAWDIHNALLPLRKEGMSRNVYMLDGNAKTEENVRDYLPAEYQGMYKLYANTDNMLIINGGGQNWNTIYNWQKEYAKSYHAFNTELRREGDIVSLYSEDGIKLTSKKTSDELTDDLKNDMLDIFRDRLSMKDYGTSTRQIAAFAKNEGYDGVIIKNITDDGGRNNNFNHYTERGDIYIFFNPNAQVKSADTVTYDDKGNVIPPSERFNKDNTDIRYSIAVTEDNTGKKLSEGQQKYFKDSKVVDDKGRLKVMYHGTPSATFTKFDLDKADDNRSFFLTDSKFVAMSYSGNGSIVDPDNLTDITTLEGAKKFLKDSDYTIKKTKEGYSLLDDGQEYLTANTVQELMQKYADEEGLENINGGVYETYVNIENPLEIDAKGQNWDEIDFTADGQTFESAAEIANYAFDKGYDGVIIKNVFDVGTFADYADMDAESEVVIAFNSNQIKSIGNENPTENDDIRYSIDVSADAFFDAYQAVEEQVKIDERELHDLIVNRMDLDSDVSKKMITEVAKNIKKMYNSTYKTENLVRDLRTVFKYFQNKRNFSMDDMMVIMDDISKPILESVKASEPEQEKLYNSIVDALKGYKIALNPEQLQEVKSHYGSYKNFVDIMKGKLNISKDGTPLDNVWTELVDKAGGMLSYGTNPNDQPIALEEAITSLNPTYAQLEGQSLESAATEVTLEIIRQFYMQESMTEAAAKVKEELSKRNAKMRETYKKYYNEALKKVEAEKAINIKRLAEEIENLTVEQQEAIKNGDALNQAYIENIKKDYQRRYEKIQKESIEKIAKTKAYYQNSWINKNLKRERSELKNRVLREVKALQNILAHPQEGATKHVPVALIKPTIAMLEAINLDNGGSNKAIVERLKKMSEVYESLKNDDSYSFDFDERTARDIEELQAMFENKSYADLGIQELDRVIEIVQALKTQIKNANNLILQGKLADAKVAAENAMEEVKGSRRLDNAVMNALNRYGNIHLNAYREFRKLSGYKDGALLDLYRNLDDGSKKEMQIQKDLGAIFTDVLEGNKNQKEVKKFISTKKEDLVDIGITDKNGKPILITRAMRMSLIMHAMNSGNMRHILGSGITVPNMYYFEKGKLDEAYAKGTNYRFVPYTEYLDALQRNDTNKIKELSTKAEERINNMKKDLSEWEKNFLRDAEKMFHEETGKLINDTSMELKGYALARVKNYFPIRTDSHFTKQEWSGLVRDGSIEGMGMLKERVISTKPILLEDITNVIQRQIKNVSKYAGYAVPIRNFETIMKQTSRDQDSGALHNLSETIDSVWGASDTKWLQNLMQDIQGGRSEKGNFLMNLRGQFAGATLTLNPSVAIKQAASYPTAAAVVGYKALGRAMADIRNGFAGKGIAELEAINPLLWYRNQGNATQELADAKAVGFGKNLPLWMQKATNWTQWFDTGTVRTLEYASMYYVDENFKNLQKGSDEYWKKVSEVFTNVVEQTQPNYSTLHKADIIRNPNSFVKMLVMFKTQPMQNFGIIYDAMGELNAAKISGDKKWINEASSKAALAISSQAVSATVFSCMTILSQLLLHRWWKYRDEEGKWSWEKFMVALGEGIISCFTGAFIGGSEIYEALKHIFTGSTYYGIEVSVAEMVNDFVENMGNLTKNAKALWDAKTEADREGAAQKLLKASINLGSTVGEFKGTPVNNIKNMLSSMYFYATDIIRSIDEGELSISDDSNIAAWDVKNQYERIYEAMRNGDSERYNKLVQELINDSVAEGTDPDEAAAAVEKKVTDKITNLMKTDYLEGNISDEEMAEYLMEEKGKTEDEAYFQMRKWTTGETSDYSIMRDNISKAAEDPTPENRKAVIEEVENLLAHGKDKSKIASDITSNYKEQYIELYNQGKAADLNSILRAALVAAGYSEEDAQGKLNKWVK